MNALWTTLEVLDRTLFSAAKKLEDLRGKEPFRAQEEKRIEHVRPPQKAITFDA